MGSVQRNCRSTTKPEEQTVEKCNQTTGPVRLSPTRSATLAQSPSALARTQPRERVIGTEIRRVESVWAPDLRSGHLRQDRGTGADGVPICKPVAERGASRGPKRLQSRKPKLAGAIYRGEPKTLKRPHSREREWGGGNVNGFLFVWNATQAIFQPDLAIVFHYIFGADHPAAST
jgi:hypothetical protein